MKSTLYSYLSPVAPPIRWRNLTMRVGIVLSLAVACTPLALALGKGKARQTSDIERVNDRGRIDWTKGVLYATGLGAVPHDDENDARAYLRGRGFAKLDALRNLLMVIDHVHIDAHTVGADYVTQSDTIRAEVSGIVRGAQVVSERKVHVGRDTMVEVTVTTHLYGDDGVASVFLPEAARREADQDNAPRHEIELEAPAPSLPAAPHEAPESPRTSEPEPEAAPINSERYTSVIIDTRGYKVERSMAPKILRRDGSEVWGTVPANPDFVISQGIVIYANTLADARVLNRAGRRPLVLKAVGEARSAVPSDAVLSDEDADRLLHLNRRDAFLDKYNVIFVLDPKH